jgi:Fe2+ transport system protein FeoA
MVVVPLSMAQTGEHNTIKKWVAKQHLENLGFVVHTPITIITTIGGNTIANIKESRVAISR